MKATERISLLAALIVLAAAVISFFSGYSIGSNQTINANVTNGSGKVYISVSPSTLSAKSGQQQLLPVGGTPLVVKDWFYPGAWVRTSD
ncbi:MAG: hypothetical protein ABSE82_12390, partial [Nitrososphaerales archaeon]